jgi:hypothetical protein
MASAAFGRRRTSHVSTLSPIESRVLGVGHPEQPLADVRRADARSRKISSPDGVALRLQVSVYSGEPAVSVI